MRGERRDYWVIWRYETCYQVDHYLGVDGRAHFVASVGAERTPEGARMIMQLGSRGPLPKRLQWSNHGALVGRIFEVWE